MLLQQCTTEISLVVESLYSAEVMCRQIEVLVSSCGRVLVSSYGQASDCFWHYTLPITVASTRIR